MKEDDDDRDDVKTFIRATAEFLAGTNQVRMSCALALPGGELKEVALLWTKMRNETPLFGYPSVDEAEKQLRNFLGVK